MTSINTLTPEATGHDDEDTAALHHKVCSTSEEDHGRREWLHFLLGVTFPGKPTKRDTWFDDVDDGSSIRISQLRPMDVEMVRALDRIRGPLDPVRIPEEHFED